MNPTRPTARHIIMKMPTFKDKERLLKTSRGKQRVTYKNRWELQTSVYLLEEKNHQQRNYQKLKRSTTGENTQTEERSNLEHPDKEIKETTPLNPYRIPT